MKEEKERYNVEKRNKNCCTNEKKEKRGENER